MLCLICSLSEFSITSIRRSRTAIRLSLVLTLNPLSRLGMEIALKAMGGLFAQPGKVQVVTIVAQPRGVNSAVIRVEDRASFGIAPSYRKAFRTDLGLGQIQPSDRHHSENEDHDTAPLTREGSLPEIQVSV